MENLPSNEDLMAQMRAVFQRDSTAIAAFVVDQQQGFPEAVRAILKCQGHVLVTGAGTSGSTATRLAHLLSCCGTPALYIDSGASQHGLIGAVTQQDVVIVVSKGGETQEVNYLASAARKRNAVIIAMTASHDTALTSLADVTISVAMPPRCDPFDTIATCSSLLFTSVSNASCETILAARGYDEVAFLGIHPGGSVGKRLGLPALNLS